MGQEPSNIVWLLLCHLELQILNEGARIRILIRKLGPGMAAHDYRLQSNYYPGSSVKGAETHQNRPLSNSKSALRLGSLYGIFLSCNHQEEDQNLTKTVWQP